MRIFILVSALALSACSSKQSSDRDFYTWVDENGNLRTEKRIKSEIKRQSSVINEAEYTSSDEMDKRLSQAKLFSWRDGFGNQLNQEEVINQSRESGDSLATLNHAISYKNFREGKQYIYSELKKKSLKLSELYTYNNQDELDYALIEIDEMVNALTFKTFIHKGRVALPDVLLLDAYYQQGYQSHSLWASHVKETWKSYGFFTGRLEVPANSKYILILPSSSTTPILIGDDVIKMTNLGEITFEEAF